MLLGLVVHVELVMEFTRGNHDLRWLYEGIHVFRMPVFFIVGGYFASSLLRRAGLRGFMLSRTKRLVAPLLAAETVIAAVLIPRGCSVCAPVGDTSWLSIGWLHLWFLAYLLFISVVFAWVAWAVSNKHRDVAQRPARRESVPLWGGLALVIGASLVLPGYQNSDGTLRMSLAIVPDLPLLALFALFFAFGWLLEKSGNTGLVQLRRAGEALLAAGAGAYFLHLNSVGRESAISYAVAMWLISLGILGISLRWLRRRSRTVGYLSHASYWIYLFHPAILVCLVIWVGPLELPVAVELVGMILLTFAGSLLSYELIARRTIIGRFLSGRRRVRRLAPIAPAGVARRWWLER